MKKKKVFKVIISICFVLFFLFSFLNTTNFISDETYKLLSGVLSSASAFSSGGLLINNSKN